MSSGPPLLGFHHATSFAGNPQSNIEFHKTALGLHLVKRTVNFDEPAAYHFYFSTEAGAPGTLLTTFRVIPCALLPGRIWWSASKGAPGPHSNSTSRPVLAKRFSRYATPMASRSEITPGEGPLHLHAVTLRVAEPGPTIAFFTQVLGFSVVAIEGSRTRLQSAGGKVLVDVLADPAAGRSRFGAGITHHIAFHVAGEAEQLAWRDLLIRANVRVSLLKDRYYFHSIYFREPSGILLEIATGGPGFLIDEPEAHLGEGLRLPPWFEPIRDKIEARLKERDVV